MLHPYHARRLTDDCTVLDAGWIPALPRSFLLGFSDFGSGEGLLLTEADAAQLRAGLIALRDGNSAAARAARDPEGYRRIILRGRGRKGAVTPADGDPEKLAYIKISHTTRGEPYRKGIEISVCDSFNAMFFLDELNTSSLIDLLGVGSTVGSTAGDDDRDPAIAAAEAEIDAETAKIAGQAGAPVVGYQILHPGTDEYWDGRPSFTVLARDTAIRELAEARKAAGDLYRLQVILEGQVEDPTFC